MVSDIVLCSFCPCGTGDEVPWTQVSWHYVQGNIVRPREFWPRTTAILWMDGPLPLCCRPHDLVEQIPASRCDAPPALTLGAHAHDADFDEDGENNELLQDEKRRALYDEIRVSVTLFRTQFLIWR